MVMRERYDRSWAFPSATGSTVMVKCFREMVLCDMASWPAKSYVRTSCTMVKAQWSGQVKVYVLPLYGRIDTSFRGEARGDGLLTESVNAKR